MSPLFGGKFYYRIKDDRPHNLLIPFGTVLNSYKKMPFGMSLYYGLNLNIYKFISIDFQHVFLSYGGKKYEDVYIANSTESDYKFNEMRIGFSFHITDITYNKRTSVELTGNFQSFISLKYRDILAVRVGYDTYKGRFEFYEKTEYPAIVRSLYIGITSTSIQTYETWAMQYGTPGGYTKYKWILDLLYMPDGSDFTRFGGEIYRFGFRAVFTAYTSLFSLTLEGGLKPGLASNVYFTLGLGSKFSFLVKPFSPY